MSRQSPVHYIAPSAINIIPNANGEVNDLAVYIEPNTVIKVYSPKAGIDHGDDGNYREWALSGRNRSLADSYVPYTIYARLNKFEESAYVTFAPKVYDEDAHEYIDKYAYVTTEGLSADVTSEEDARGYWYIKIGEVSAPENTESGLLRTVTLDTGVLGTDEYNTKWNLSPEALPLRLSLECMIDGETPKDAGPTPYVYWNQVATLTAHITEGWNGTDIQRFDHWEIVRNTGNAVADAAWNTAHNIQMLDYWRTGVINLQHQRGAEQTDDFDGTVSAIFTVNAMQLSPEWDGSSTEPQYILLKSASINIMAETVEDVEPVPDTAVVSYNPQTGAFAPSQYVYIYFRSKNQKRESAEVSIAQWQSVGTLKAWYSVQGTNTWTELSVTSYSGSDKAATRITTNSVFSEGKSVVIRVTRTVDGNNVEISRSTIAYVRDGEDSKEREWIFLRSAEPITFGPPEHPYPAWINIGEVNPAGEADGNDNNMDQDGWVPNGWWDEQQGVDATNRYEYGAYRDFVHESNGVTAHWGAFTEPRIWNHWGKDGEAGDDGLYYVDDYRRYDSRSTNATTGAPAGNSDMQGWVETAPAPTETYKYIWKRSRQYNPNTQQFVGNPIYVCLTGERGVDAQDIEWAFIRTKTDTAPVILSDSTYVDSNSHDYTDDDHLPHVSGNSNVENNEGTYECTDDPKGVDDTWKFEWEIKREKADADSDGKRAWNYYQGSMTLHANYAESAYIIDLSNDNDQFGTDSNSFVQAQQTRSTTVSVYDGATKQTLSNLTVELEYEDGTPVSGHDVANYSANAATGVVSVILERNTAAAFSHTEVRALITASVTGKADKQAVFTVRKVTSGQPGLSPTVYQLNPTSKDFVFNRGADGQTLTPAARSTTVNALKTYENVTSDATLADSLTFTWGFDESATAQGSGTVGDSSNNVISVSSTLAAAHHQVWILLSTGDRETLPILKDGQKGDNGADGGNTATVMLYKRSAATVTSVGIIATLYYKFTTKNLYTDAACTTEATTQLNGWSLDIPAGTDPIYTTAAVAFSTVSYDGIVSSEWVAPVQFTGNGEDGADGLSTAAVFLYKRSATTVTAHGIIATLHYKFADGKLYVKSGSTYTEATSADLNNWQREIPASNGNPCYAIQAAALGTGDYDSVMPADWSGATKIVEDGIDGQDMRENLIDRSRPSYEVDLSDESQRWQTYTNNDLRYITDKVFDPDAIPDGTPLSGQMRLTLSGCTYASDATVGIYISGVNRWPFIARLVPVSADGTYVVKIENFTIASGHGAWDGKVRLQVKGCGTSGTVSVSRVKLEVGEKCSDWCLSENDKKGQQGPQGAAGGPSKVYRQLTAGCLYFCASDGVAERVGVLNSQDYVAVRARKGDGYDSGWIMYRCTESFLATAAAIAPLNEAIADYEGGGETTKSQIDAAMAASSLTPQSSGIPLGKGAFAEIATNQTAAFFTQLVAKNANIEVLTGAQYYIVDENNITAGGFGKVEDENDGKTYMIWAGGETPSAAPFAVDSGGNVKMETGVFGGFLKNTARVITAKNVKDYVSWGITEDWYLDSTTNTYKQRQGWILDLDKAGSNVIFFSGSADQEGTGISYGSIRLELERMTEEKKRKAQEEGEEFSYTDGVDYHNEIYVPLPWYANKVNKTIGGESGDMEWFIYAKERMGLSSKQAYTRPNIALQYIDSHYRVVNATSHRDDYQYVTPENGVFRVRFAGLEDMHDMTHDNDNGLVPFPAYYNDGQSELVLDCKAGYRSVASGTAYGVWWKPAMRNGGPDSAHPHLFSAAWMYVYGLIPL